MISKAITDQKINEGTSAFEKNDLYKVANAGGAMLFASAFGNGLNFAFGIFVARALGPHQFGLYALGLTIFNTLSLIVPLSLDTGVVKFVSQQRGLGEQDKARSTILQVVSITILSGLLSGLGLALLSGWLSITIYKNAALIPVLLFFAVATPMFSITTVLVSVIQAFHTIRHTLLIKYLWEPVGRFILAALLLWAGFGLHGVLAAWVFTLGVSVIVAFRSTSRIADISLQRIPSWIPGNLQAILAYCFPLIIATVFRVVAPRSDLLILGYWTKPSDVGIYNAAFQTSAILALILGSFSTSFTPMIGKAFANEDVATVKALYQAICRWVFMFTLPLFICMVIFRQEILRVFGMEFVAGADCLVILAGGQLFNTVIGGANTILLMSGHSKKVMLNTIIIGLFLMAANWIIIPQLGILGAAISASLGLTLTNLVRAFQVWRLVKIQPCTASLVKPLLAGAIAGGMAWAVKCFLPSAHVIVSLSVLVFVYSVFLFSLKFEQTDRLMFSMIMNRIASLRYSGDTMNK